MDFNLLDLHDGNKDCKLRQCLRAYSVLPKYANQPCDCNHSAEKLVLVLRKINNSLNENLGNSWKREWEVVIGYKMGKTTSKDWFIGRASIPLVAIGKLRLFCSKSDFEELCGRIKYITSTTGFPVMLPLKNSEDLAYLAGAILGDGHLLRSKHRISYQLTDEFLIKKFQNKLQNAFGHKFNYRVGEPHLGLKLLYRLDITNKAIARFFNNFFDIPVGKKSHKIIVPSIINKSSLAIKLAFLEGVFDTDGGRRHGGFGLSSASKQFRDGIAVLLQGLSIRVNKDEWLNKKYNNKYYGLYFSKNSPNLTFLHG